MATRPEIRLVVTGQSRPGRRFVCSPGDRADPDLARIGTLAASAGRVVIVGGEPTLRPDLPQIVRAVADAAGAPPTLLTDGLGLGRPGALAPLVDAGLAGIRVLFASARTDAHDWVMGHPGAARSATRTLKAARTHGLDVSVEVPLTRPTAPWLQETVRVAARLGATSALLRRVTADEVEPSDRVTVLTRLATLGDLLRSASVVAETLGVSLTTEGVPDRLVGDGPSIDRTTARWLPPRPTSPSRGCDDGRGAPDCGGVEADYLRLFGEPEFLRAPPPDRLDLPLQGTARDVKQRLVRAVVAGVPTLRITAIDHDDAAALLRESTRVGFDRVEVVADLRPLASLSDDELHRIRRLDLLDSSTSLPADLQARILKLCPRVELRSPR